MVDRDVLRVEEIDLGVTPDAARRTDIGDSNDHLTRAGEPLCVTREDHQLVAGAGEGQ
jgi:hypothetical protein